MTTLEIEPATREMGPALAVVAAQAQTDPERFVAYFGETAGTIGEELAGVPDWAANTVVARRAERVTGWLTAETDGELHRVWWWGPVVAPGDGWAEVADALYVAARARLAPTFGQEELAPDASSVVFCAFADRHGFHPEEASTVLRTDIGATAVDARVTAAAPADHDGLVALHDALFPGTHTTGRQLVEAADGMRLVVRADSGIVGYVAVELQTGGDGYIDFLGVDPGHRGHGIGRALVATALDELHRRGATTAHLTVREANTAARRLYRSLGFTELRDIRPYRRGFHLG